MPKVLFSPVKRFPGTITLPDSLTYPQLIAWEQALAAAQADGATNIQRWYALIPGVVACVEKWELAGVPEYPTADTLPSTPRVAADKLLRWVMDGIRSAIAEDDDAPNV